MTYVIFSRIFVLKSPFFPDRKHIHHRFLDKGLNYNDAVSRIYLLTLPTIFIALFIEFTIR